MSNNETPDSTSNNGKPMQTSISSECTGMTKNLASLEAQLSRTAGYLFLVASLMFRGQSSLLCASSSPMQRNSSRRTVCWQFNEWCASGGTSWSAQICVTVTPSTSQSKMLNATIKRLSVDLMPFNKYHALVLFGVSSVLPVKHQMRKVRTTPTPKIHKYTITCQWMRPSNLGIMGTSNAAEQNTIRIIGPKKKLIISVNGAITKIMITNGFTIGVTRRKVKRNGMSKMRGKQLDPSFGVPNGSFVGSRARYGQLLCMRQMVLATTLKYHASTSPVHSGWATSSAQCEAKAAAV
mmetsp:Transcript_74080/g.205838  ORF Transcript_74080/g.205838 Transcript_74080/m.205838 type:complete len:294 (+) Transcript_74080:1810-2691(+)